MPITLQNDAPAPAVGKPSVKYPIRDMQLGDSFVIPRAGVASVRAIVSRLNKQGDAKYIVRKYAQADAWPEFRCWRII